MPDMTGKDAVRSYDVDDTISGRYLTFSLDGQEYAIPLLYVVDIINLQGYTYVPSCPDFLVGVTNLRGKVIPLIDVRIRFGKEPVPYHERTCIIVVEHNDYAVGLVIDSVREVITLLAESITPPPKQSAGGETGFICNIGTTENGIKLILDCAAILGESTLEQIASTE